MEERGSPILNALAELPEPDHPARRVIDEHRQREHQRILQLCREVGFPDAELVADEFFFLLEGAKSCVQCIGLKRVGQHLMRLVDTICRREGIAVDTGEPTQATAAAPPQPARSHDA